MTSKSSDVNPRSATGFHSCTDRLGRRISYITSNEVGVVPVGVHSIHDSGSNQPSFRRRAASDAPMTEADEPIPSKGLIVLWNEQIRSSDPIGGPDHDRY